MKKKRIQGIGRIEISICHEVEDRDNGKAKRLLSISRFITLDGKEVYKDKMSPEMYMASKDPIRDIECFLLKLEESKDGRNIGGNSRKRDNFFAQIWRKLFCKKIQFVA